jgi:hypothetical protein
MLHGLCGKINNVKKEQCEEKITIFAPLYF